MLTLVISRWSLLLLSCPISPIPWKGFPLFAPTQKPEYREADLYQPLQIGLPRLQAGKGGLEGPVENVQLPELV